MKVLENGIYREATSEELALFGQAEVLPYKDRVIARIHQRYSIDDEMAILRQKDEKPEEYAEYYAFVEQIKAEERDRV